VFSRVSFKLNSVLVRLYVGGFPAKSTPAEFITIPESDKDFI
jgi:hypothetical protein